MRKTMLIALVVLTMGVGSACNAPEPSTPDATGGSTTPSAAETTSPAVIQYESTHELPPTGGLKIVP